MSLARPSTLLAALALSLALGGQALEAQGQSGLEDGGAGAYLAARSANFTSDFDDGRVYLTRALLADPDNVELMEGLLSAHLAAGDFASAVPVARKLEQMVPGQQLAGIVLLGDLMVRDDHEAVLARLAEGQPVGGALLDPMLKAWAELGAGRMSVAIEEFDKLAARPGLGVFGLYFKALALGMVGDLEGADAILSDRANGLISLRRAVWAHVQVLSQLDRNADALALLDEVFGTSPDPEIDGLRTALNAGTALPFDMLRNARDGAAEVFHMIAVAFQGDAPPVQTLIYSRMAEQLRPDLADALLLTAISLEALGQDDLALGAFQRIGSDSPVHLVAETGEAQLLYRSGRKAEALAAMEALARREAKNASVQIALGDMLRREERFGEAAALYSRAIDIVGLADSEAIRWGLYYARAMAWERAGEWGKAEADFEQALRLSPDQPDVLNYYGYSLLDRNIRIDAALEMIRKAVAQRPEDGHIIDSLGWGYFLTGRYPEAVVEIERAALLMPVDPVVTDHLGDVYWAVGRKREAQFQWRRALSFKPEEKDAALIRRKLEAGLDQVLVEQKLPALAGRGQPAAPKQ